MSANTSEALRNRLVKAPEFFGMPTSSDLHMTSGEHNLYAEVAQGMIAELASLRARCDAAEKDAERYTKFRKGWFKYWASPSYEDDVSEAKTEAALDKAIDDLTAERAKEGEPK